VQRRILARQRRQRRYPRIRRRSISHRSAQVAVPGRRPHQRPNLSVKLDDPSFPAPIYASLVKSDGDHSYTLIWSAATATDATESNGHVLFGAGVRARTQRGSYSDLSFESACCGAVRIMTIAARLMARGRNFDSCRQWAGTVLTVPAMPITRRRRRRRLHALP
jgi:uncharacterized protein DUF736